ncbi:amidase domain-containing protein [Streptomyces sp. UNOC14_S4]|nr:amidase domain-containing protein [Streptomyces sp. UNOC14_S4]
MPATFRSTRVARAAVGAALTVAVSAVLLPAASASAAPQPRSVDGETAKAFSRIADALLTERTEMLVDGRSARHSAPKADRNVRLSTNLAKNEDSALFSLRTRKDRLASLGEVYTSADTKVSTDKVQVKNGRAMVLVTEVTTFTYKKVRGDEPTTTGFRAHHELNFTAANGGKWELTGIRPTDSGPRPVNQPATKPAATPVTSPQEAKPASIDRPWRPSQPKTSTTYDYKAMAAYAEKYWSNYNPAYRKFNDVGGDCTNFISQALKAGGWKPAPGATESNRSWWYDSTNQSTSWVGANEWSWYAMQSKRVTSLDNVYDLGIGDILQMDFDGDGSKDHSMITTYKSRSGVPYLTYHSTNTFRKSVASIIASYPDSVYYAYRT